MAHAITLQSPLGKSLRFVRMSAREELGRPYAFALHGISRDVAIDLRGLLGKPMAVKLVSPQGDKRHYHGIVCAAEQTGFEQIEGLRYSTYAFSLVPKLWLLGQRRDCRIYKNKSVPQLVRALLADVGYSDVKLRLSASYAPREYCVQYRESGLDFISRLMEQEGIYYYFEHTASTHTMVLADGLGAHVAVAPFARIPYCPPGQKGSRMKDAITDWSLARTARSTRVRLDDYDHLKPKTSLRADETPAESAGAALGDLDVFDYPGEHLDVATGRRHAQVRAEALNVAQAQYQGLTDACGLQVGALFKLRDFPQAEHNQEYLVVGADTELVEVDYVSGGEEVAEPFSCAFRALRSRQPFRTAQTTPRPTIAGLQTAVVEGTRAEDIAVDQHGRVQVNFFWSPPGTPNADCSCPVRVAQSWAGKRWGAQQIPRVGHEVVVSFLEGNPDRPLIIGSVYNADNPPPYALPANRTQSGVRSRSHPNGGAQDYNEICFEDRKGKEELLLHAQRDLRHEAEHDEIGETGNDRSQKVGRNDRLDVGRSLRIEAGTEIDLVCGPARLQLRRTGEVVISGTRITLDGRVGVAINAGASVEVAAQASLLMRANASVLIQSNAVATVRANAALVLNASGPATLKGTPTTVGSSLVVP
ncbi:type VI secretion system Vgr family protein [Xanthomonas translucens]|uniref:type VI secretion system Vgr family protein n=1 Tax=Xanthomonas campestris pv. translucens TaxID=343 RepID=UPI00071E8B1B|nr:type VI secretion system tip protein TssI/VgrG [Xanthomonas translucens]UJB16337.1 type VI secretion system tip protein VgrG [Xanthomonas translucens pv. undulosa]